MTPVVIVDSGVLQQTSNGSTMWTDTTRGHHASAALALPSDLTDVEWVLLMVSVPFSPKVTGTVPNVGATGSSVHITSMPSTFPRQPWPTPRDAHVWNSPRYFCPKMPLTPGSSHKLLALRCRLGGRQTPHLFRSAIRPLLWVKLVRKPSQGVVIARDFTSVSMTSNQARQLGKAIDTRQRNSRVRPVHRYSPIESPRAAVCVP